MQPHVFEEARGLRELIKPVAVFPLGCLKKPSVLVMLQERLRDTEVPREVTDPILLERFHRGFRFSVTA